jgi:hypothetical protein
VPIVSDDTHAVNSADVQAVVKTDDAAAEMYWVTVSLQNGQTVNFRFPDAGPMADFYKTLVDAMGQ